MNVPGAEESQSRSKGGYYEMSEPQRQTANLSSLEQPMQSPVTFQPDLGFSANVQFMDAISKEVYNKIPGRHMTSAQVLQCIQDAGQHLVNAFDSQQRQSQESIGYNQMMKSLVLHGEEVQLFSQNTWGLPYKSLTYYDECMKPFKTQTAGIVMLTNKRLILLSAQFASYMELKEYGDPKKIGGYTVSSSYHDNTFYQPISLTNFRSVEIVGCSGMSGQINVTAQQPCCNGLCACLGGCIASALKQWSLQPIISNQYTNLTIKMGVLLPPWGAKCFLDIEVAPNVSVALARDFVASFQQVTPGLM